MDSTSHSKSPVCEYAALDAALHSIRRRRSFPRPNRAQLLRPAKIVVDWTLNGKPPQRNGTRHNTTAVTSSDVGRPPMADVGTAAHRLPTGPTIPNYTRPSPDSTHQLSSTLTKGPFKCYVTLFSWEFDPHPPPRNTNNVEPYTSVTLFSRKAHTHPPPSALRNT